MMKTKLIKIPNNSITQLQDEPLYSALVLMADTIEPSLRLYPYDELTRAMNDFKAKLARTGIYGELSPTSRETTDTEIAKISHSIIDVSMTAHNFLEVTIATLRTPNGILLKKMLDDEVCVFLKMKGHGVVSASGTVSELEFVTFDADLMQNMRSFESVRVNF